MKPNHENTTKIAGGPSEKVDAAFAGSIIKRLHARVHELEREKEPKRTAARGCPCECPARSVTILEDRFGSIFGYHCSQCRHDHKLKRKVRRGN